MLLKLDAWWIVFIKCTMMYHDDLLNLNTVHFSLNALMYIMQGLGNSMAHHICLSEHVLYVKDASLCIRLFEN